METRRSARRGGPGRRAAGSRVLVTLAAAILLAVSAPPLQATTDLALRPRYDIPRATGEIRVDGRLDEAAWDGAAAIEVAWEIDPGENLPAPVETTAYVTYDQDQLYIAFDARDPEPSAIRAHLSDRDSAFQDDFVGVMLDTFNDERRAFEFFVNPLGVQMDLTRDDLNGGREDSAWDTIWASAGRITEQGFEVEMAIPWSSLRFQQADGPQTWGLLAFRSYPRSIRRQILSVPKDLDVSCTLCQGGKAVGFDGVSPGRNLEIVPTLTAGRTDTREAFPGGPYREGDVDSEVGATVSWGVTPNITLSGTVNPDFSQVEADAAQLDVNNQFALFFPEQRPFFLEGADFFRTPLDVVFTRTVADPSWGTKLTGKAGDGAFGVMVAQDEVTNLLIPGAESSRTTSLDLESTATVLRYRQDVGEASALGVLYTGRSGGDYENHLAGVDGLWRFDDQNSVRFQVLGSRTRYPGQVAEELGQPGGDLEDLAIFSRYNYDSRHWTAYVRYDQRGEDFRADLGFLPRVGYRTGLAGGSYAWIGEEGDWYTRFSLGGDYDVTEDSDGNLLEREAEIFIEYSGPLQSSGFLGPGTRTRVFDGVEFQEDYLNFYANLQPTGGVELVLDGRVGDQIDFANTRLGEVLSLRPIVALRLGRQTRLRLDHRYEHLDVPGGRLFEANLSQARVVYQLNLRTFVRAIVQYRDILRDPELYEDDVAAETRALFTQLLFSYKVNPRTVLFLGYSDQSLGDESIDLTRESRSLFLKVGYAWVG